MEGVKSLLIFIYKTINMPNKDPIQVNELIIKRWGSIKTENGTAILAVSSAGVVSQTAPAGGEWQISGSAHTNFRAASGQPILATAGTDTTVTASRLYCTKVFIPYSCTITGLAFLIGSVGGTHKAVVSMYTAAGVLVANSAIAGSGTTVWTAANMQALDFLVPYAAVWPAYYRVGVNYSGTTPTLRTYPIPWANFWTGRLTQTVGTPADITPPTTYTADFAPFIMTY